MVLNERYVSDGDIVYRQACRLGLRGHRVEAARLALSLRPIQAVGEGEESRRPGSAAEGGGRMALNCAAKDWPQI